MRLARFGSGGEWVSVQENRKHKIVSLAKTSENNLARKKNKKNRKRPSNQKRKNHNLIHHIVQALVFFLFSFSFPFSPLSVHLTVCLCVCVCVSVAEVSKYNGRR
jgi:hypothetical protein